MKLQVIMPVGPGHESTYKRAANSVMVATKVGHYRKMPWDKVEVKIADDSNGGMGRSAARNQLVQNSDSDWLFFLDADDLMHPEALIWVEPHMETRDAIFGTIIERVGQWLELKRTQIPEIWSYEELLEFDPTQTIQMGHFVRAEVAKELPFDSGMKTGEDWDYYLRLWKEYRCAKVQLPLMINVRGEHSTGQQSASGAEWSRVVGKMIAEARNKYRREKLAKEVA